ncbi:hypothetical protein [Thioalkalivibrio sp. ALMg13-2]|uniref:hypothetical protein n=1 Tax=Thioalkalivibrio sp. ALMg13-2 TaxID=1158167 RepID=UPI0012DFD625|nr:hypothetical protein [Thioalkalivibrio sp. ALMg13-2]
MSNKKIAYVSVHLDDDVPDYMSGVIRCGSVISEDEYGSELKDHQELIDNAEFRSEGELIEYIASKIGVSKDIVGIKA